MPKREQLYQEALVRIKPLIESNQPPELSVDELEEIDQLLDLIDKYESGL